jgi:hypothetical protein
MNCKNTSKLLLIVDDSLKFKNIMKKHFSIFLISAFAIFSGIGLSAQGNDDLYFDGVEKPKKQEIVAEEPELKQDQELSAEDDYVDENYEYEYSARIRRFHQPARGFSYYSNYYTDNYWYDPFMPGMNIYVVQPYYMHNSWGWSYPYSSWGYGYSSWGYGWSSYGGFNNYYNVGYSPWGNQWGYSPYWSGYNQGYWNGWYNNGWYNNGWHHQNNNLNGWFESAAPNAGNFVTNRSPRGSDTGIHRSRNTPVQGYDNQQRQIQNSPDRMNPDKVGRQRETTTNPNVNPNVRPDVRPNVRPDVRPDIREPQPNVRPDRVSPQPSVRPQINPTVKPPVRETNPTRTIPERRRDNSGFDNNSFNNNFNNSFNNGNSGFNGSGRSSTPSPAPSPALRSSGGRR